jgi:hypothetical protein
VCILRNDLRYILRLWFVELIRWPEINNTLKNPSATEINKGEIPVAGDLSLCSIVPKSFVFLQMNDIPCHRRRINRVFFIKNRANSEVSVLQFNFPSGVIHSKVSRGYEQD